MDTLQRFVTLEGSTGLPAAFFFVAVAGVGAIIGSFLNVVIHRVPREESIAFPASRCPSCGTAIRPYDNIPVFSWAVLRGRCRSCRAPISARYPAVELLTATLFALTFWLRSGLTLSLPFDLAFVAAIIALVFIDAEHMILPNSITYPVAFIASRGLHRGTRRRRVSVARGLAVGARARRGGDGPRRREDDVHGRRLPRLAAHTPDDLRRRADRLNHGRRNDAQARASRHADAPALRHLPRRRLARQPPLRHTDH
ncbi:MAG: hypothetical protein DMF65_13800 [Acidobacteria bacterium]|nr:MAG: hypothetical protein DMF65_13800 [Acidobacteriota bacterium]